jgi:citrate lyase subunit beta/citryl-CoA lyase
MTLVIVVAADRKAITVPEPFQTRGPALLFCPADRPHLFAKALDRADLVAIDLEDAVAAADKLAARAAIVANPIDPDRTVIRINAHATADYNADLEALDATSYRVVMLPKSESVEQVRALARWRVIALCETPLGIFNAQAIAAADNVVGLMWGSEDLMATMGGRSSRDDDGRLRGIAEHARSTVLLAARAYGRQAIDSVYTDIADLDGLARESTDAVASGFDVKACIHPSQVPVVRRSFRPTDAQLDWARRVLEAMSSNGVTRLDGQMIDAPVAQRAQSMLRWQDRPVAGPTHRGD